MAWHPRSPLFSVPSWGANAAPPPASNAARASDQQLSPAGNVPSLQHMGQWQQTPYPSQATPGSSSHLRPSLGSPPYWAVSVDPRAQQAAGYGQRSGGGGGNAFMSPPRAGTSHTSAGQGWQSRGGQPEGGTASRGARSDVASVDAVASRVRLEMIQEGGASYLRLVQKVLAQLGARSWEDVGVRAFDVPTLRKMAALENKVSSFFHAYVACHSIATLHDLGRDLAAEEGVASFQDLGLGPLEEYPLAQRYFAAGRGLLEVPAITTEDVIGSLFHLLKDRGRAGARVEVQDLLVHIAKQRNIDSPEELGVRVAGLGLYVALYSRLRSTEQRAVERFEAAQIRKGACDETPALLAEAEEQLAASRKKAQHIRFDKASDDEAASDSSSDESDGESQRPAKKQKTQSVPSGSLVGRAGSSCPYPSRAEELAATRAKQKTIQQNVQEAENEQVPKKYQPARMTDGEVQMFINSKRRLVRSGGDDVPGFLYRLLPPVAILKGKTPEARRKKKEAKARRQRVDTFLSAEGKGLLNVAVRCIAGDCAGASKTEEGGPASGLREEERKEETNGIDEQRGEAEADLEEGRAPECFTNDEAPPFVIEDAPLLEYAVSHFHEQWDQWQGERDQQPGRGEGSRGWSPLLWAQRCKRDMGAHFSGGTGSAAGGIETSRPKLPSLLSLLERSADLVPAAMASRLGLASSQRAQLIQGGGKTAAMVPLARVLQVAAQALRLEGGAQSAERECAEQETVAAALRAQFEVRQVEQLGWGPVEDLVREAKQGQAGEQASRVLFVGPLLQPQVSEEKRSLNGQKMDASVAIQRVVGRLGDVTRKQALQAIEAVPPLADVAAFTQWEAVFEPTRGPLLDFLESVRAGGKELDRWRFLVLPRGRVLKLSKPDSAADAFLEAAIHRDARAATSALIAAIVEYGGVKQNPIGLLQMHATSAVQIIAKSSAPEDSQCTEDLVLQCLELCPEPLTPCIADVLLPALASMGKSAAKFWLNRASEDQRRVLHKLGLERGVSEWVDDYRATMLQSRREEKMDLQEGPPLKTSKESTVDEAEGSVAIKVVDKEVVGRGMPVEPRPDAEHEYEDKEVELCESPQGLEAASLVQADDRGAQAEATSVSTSEEEARAVVERIRREEFGLGYALGASESALMARQHERMGRALQRLSSELYSGDSHFVLELVQNADDNAYEAGVVPTLAFVLGAEGRSVTVLNNERGFSASNVRALCDVGRSTKGSGGQGYIGQKGIGFKSVFRVTNAPEIHSNGYHVRFDLAQGPLGFILPEWAPNSSPLPLAGPLPLSADCKVTWQTRIELPIKASLRGSAVAAKFSDLHPSLLLFLQRLRRLALVDGTAHDKQRTVIMERTDLPQEGLVQVAVQSAHSPQDASTSVQTWLACRRTLQSPIARGDVTSTEVALAFPLRKNAEGGWEAVAEDPQQVFAYLPLRSYGLRFLAQADFLVPSSREDVDQDASWNQWLRGEIATALVAALPGFKKLFAGGGGKRGDEASLGTEGRAAGVNAFMRFVPLEGEVLGFFAPLPRLILQKLHALRCMPVEGRPDLEALPCQTLAGWTEDVAALIPAAMLKEHFGLFYLDSRVELPAALQASLGLAAFGPKMLVQLLSSLCRTGAISNLGLPWLARCFSLLSSSLDAAAQDFHRAHPHSAFGLESQLLRELRLLPIIPLEAGAFRSISEGPIWFPASMRQDGSEGGEVFAAALLAEYPLVGKSLTTVALPLLRDSDDLHSGGLVALLRKLGVEPLSTHQVVEGHVLPLLLNEGAETQAPDALVQSVQFVKKHAEGGCAKCHFASRRKGGTWLTEKLRGGMPLLLRDGGVVRLGAAAVHFSRGMGSPLDLAAVCPQVAWNVLSERYLQAGPLSQDGMPIPEDREREVASWRAFLKPLGVTDCLQVTAVEVRVSDRASSVWKDCDWGHAKTGPALVRDWHCQEFEAGVQALTVDTNGAALGQLAEVLDRCWEADFKGCDETTWVQEQPEQASTSGRLPSSFALQLHTLAWLPVRLHAPGAQSLLRSPSVLFHDCPAVRDVLGPLAPYPACNLKDEAFVGVLGLKRSVTAEDALRVLADVVQEARPVALKLSQMDALYGVIEDALAQNDTQGSDAVKSPFREQPLFWVPAPRQSSGNSVTVEGFWRRASDLCWTDPTDALQAAGVTAGKGEKAGCVQALSAYYPSRKALFVERLGLVKQHPSIQDYTAALELLVARTPAKALNKVLRVFSHWAAAWQHSRLPAADLSMVREQLQQKRLLPTMDKQWVALSDGVYLNDDPEAAAHFQNQSSIRLVHVAAAGDSAADVKLREELLAACGVPRLSASVTQEVICYGAQPCPPLHTLVSWALPFAQRFLRQHQPALYSQASLARLKRLQCHVTDELFVRPRLGHARARGARRAVGCALQGETLHVTPAYEEDPYAVFAEVSRLFFDGRQDLPLANFLHVLLLMQKAGKDAPALDKFVTASQGVPPLPETELVWTLDEASDAVPVHSEKGPEALAERKPDLAVRVEPASFAEQPASVGATARSGGEKRKRGVWPPPAGVGWWQGEKRGEDVDTKRQRVLASEQETNLEEALGGLGAGGAVLQAGGASEEIGSDGGKASQPPEAGGASPPQGLPSSTALVECLNQQQWKQDGERGKENKLAVGRAGEEIVYEHLVEKHGRGAVQWVNQEGESGACYDVVVNKDDGTCEYLEVKATKTTDKNWFEISPKEWEFAVQQGEHFHIIRVYGASQTDEGAPLRMLRLSNPAKLWHEGLVQLCLVI